MLAIKGVFREGLAQPTVNVKSREGEPAFITFLEGEALKDERPDAQTKIKRQTQEREWWDQLFSRKLTMGSHPLALDLSDMSGDDFLL